MHYFNHIYETRGCCQSKKGKKKVRKSKNLKMYMEIEFFCIISHMTPTRLIEYICVNIKYISRGYCRSKGCHKDVKRVKYSYKMLIIKNRQKCKILNCP